MNYYENQLKKLTNFETINLKITDYEGNQTNNLGVNLESIPVLREFLDKIEADLIKKNKEV